MKPILKLLSLAVALAFSAHAADEPSVPPPTVVVTNKVPTRAMPARLTNAPAAASAASTNTTAAAAPAPAPAPAKTPAPMVTPAQNKTPIATLPQFPAPGAAARPTTNKIAAVGATNTANRAVTTATPVVPGTPQPPGGAARNVAGATAPGANTATAPGLAAGVEKGRDEDILPAGMIKFQDADISQVLEIYQELTGRTVLKPSSLPATKVSIKTQTELSRTEAIQALDSILSMNGITMVPQGTKFVKAVAEAQAGNAAGGLNDIPGELLPDSGTYITHVIQLTNASPNDVMPVLTPFSKAPNSILTIPSTGMIVLRDYAENVKRMLEMIAKIDVVPIQEYESVVIPIKYALAGDIQQVLSGLTAGGGGGTTIGGQRSNTGLSSGGGSGGFGGAGGMGGMGGMGGQQGYGNQSGMNRQGGLGGMGGASGLGGGGAGGRGSFANRLQQIAGQRGGAGAGGGAGDIFVLGNTKIIADERINALLIFASKSDLITISNIIDKLDVVLAQVVIEAIIMQVSLNDKLNYGFSYAQTRETGGGYLGGALGALNSPGVGFLGLENFGGTSSNGAGGLSEGFSYAASFMDFDATVKALASDGRIKILQRPRIQTSHAVEANLFVGQTRPYPTGTSYGGFGGNGTSIQQLQIGVTLSVLPLINAEGLVVMDIRQKIQDVGDEVTIQNVGSVPSTIDREANAKVAVRDGETVMLGGMIAATKSNSKSGIPILKDIPFLGALFRSTRNSDERSELVVLIRPTVLPTPEAAASFAKDQRKTLPATSGAFDDFEESERKLVETETKRVEARRKQEEKKNRKLQEKEGFSK